MNILEKSLYIIIIIILILIIIGIVSGSIYKKKKQCDQILARVFQCSVQKAKCFLSNVSLSTPICNIKTQENFESYLMNITDTDYNSIISTMDNCGIKKFWN
jgi:hypothetical protein